MLAFMLFFLIIFQAFQTYPFRRDSRPSAKPDRAFFDPEKDNFFDLEMN
jgi:hypothetical protein